MKINLERGYSKTILERGLEYYNRGCVKIVNIRDNVIEARVKGTHNYQVHVEIENGEVIDDSCDCPYNYEHGECKHITAVLYYLNNVDTENVKNDDNVSAILDKINEKELKNFLSNLIENDESIYDLFRRNFVDYFPRISSDDYRRKINKAINDAGGGDGFIDYKEGYEYTRKMYEFTNEALNLVDKGDYETAFVIVKIIMDSIPDTDIDGSNGEVGEVSYECIKVIKSIMNKAPKNDKTIRDIFDYILSELKTHNLSNYGVELDELIIDFIRDGLFISECETALINAIKDCEDDRKWYSYSKKDYLKYLNELYDFVADNTKKIKLMEDNLDEIDIFKEYIEMLMQKHDIKDIITDLINFRKKYPQHQKYISDKLLEIYKNNNMDLEYKEELYDAFFEFDKFNFEKYIKIKNLYGKKDWMNEVEHIISKVKTSTNHYDILTKIFIEEKMIDNLFDLVKNKWDISYYEKYLLPKYRDELVEIDIKNCKRKLEMASDRKGYRDIAKELSHIKELDINKKYINEFLVFIRTAYSKRPALMEEISHI